MTIRLIQVDNHITSRSADFRNLARDSSAEGRRSKVNLISISTLYLNILSSIFPGSISIMAYELYRHTTLGMCLQDALDEMISSQQVSPTLALQVLKQFDRSINKALSSRVRTRYTFKGRLKTYRYCDNVWTCILHNVELKENQGADLIQVDKVKIVACDANHAPTGSSEGGATAS